jgi:hypothetical protein
VAALWVLLAEAPNGARLLVAGSSGAHDDDDAPRTTLLATLLHLLAWPHPPHTLPSIHR